MLTITVFDNDENFLQFLDPDLCSITEKHSKDGLRTLEFEYKFQELHTDKQLFRKGNKIWVSGDVNLEDCLYVINTQVKESVYKDNSFTFDVEEVLVELNYAAPISQTDITAANGFTVTNTNDGVTVTINWNALNIWFGPYFNMGVVQNCINSTVSKIKVSGTINLMNLLRLIEEETGNVFVTRYEKDLYTNVIHRYLDFLNPLNVKKPWVLYLDYTFMDDTTVNGVFDSDGNLTEDTFEDVENENDITTFPESEPVYNLDPTTTAFRITNGMETLNSDGMVYDESDPEQTQLEWDSETIGFDSSVTDAVICLSMDSSQTIVLDVNNKSFVIPSSENKDPGSYPGSGYVVPGTPSQDQKIKDCVLPDDSIFEIYDTTTDKTVFSTYINRMIGTVHEEILDFGSNVENITLETDEEDTFNAIAPILSLNDSSDASNSLSRSDMNKIITAWKNLEISKGDTVPMIIEKISVKKPTLAEAKSYLGTSTINNNYWSRPYKPTDNIDSDNSSNNTWEFWRGTAYWTAPFDKMSGEIFVSTDNVFTTEYTQVKGRPDTRDELGPLILPKIGNVETSDEDVYAIFNAVCLKLKEKQEPVVDIDIDVANLRNGTFNQYHLHDKVYVKLPDSQELITARVVETSKEAHDIAKNTVKLSNYTTSNLKTIPNRTYIDASNVEFKYPQKKTVQIRLVNEDWNDRDSNSIHYPANKLITVQVYNVNENNVTLSKKVYAKRTNANGYANITLKYNPGLYQLRINFGGDEEYEESSLTIDVNVTGTKEVVKTTTKSVIPSKQKTNSKTTSKSKTVKTKEYYTKYGVSPDGKYIMGIGRPSAGNELGKYGYKFYKTVFVRKCPMCGSKELYWSIFWAGNEHGNWGTFPATGRRESGSAEAQIFCKKCDADYSIFGNNHNSAHKDLKVYKKPVKSSKTEAYKLKKGKMLYETVTKTVKTRDVTSNKSRTSVATIEESVRKQALAIVGNSTDLAAFKKIVSWVHTHIEYERYRNFKRTPATVLKRGCANCCDQTRLILTLGDAAGCTDSLTMKYVNVSSGSKGHVFSKIITKASGKWRYVDTCVWKTKNPWGNYVKGYGNPPGSQSTYPTLPF